MRQGADDEQFKEVLESFPSVDTKVLEAWACAERPQASATTEIARMRLMLNGETIFPNSPGLLNDFDRFYHILHLSWS